MTLAEYLRRKRVTPGEFAAQCGINHGTLSRLIRGVSWPRKKLALKIDKVTGSRINWNTMLRNPTGEEE
jgi:transcriptional regulator with XRE-family HTH domain